ncbi:MAG: S41 family peptidase [Candidatus Omnitrophica bacterium]|nr:S41 family peptidase [Candidatus Omnitrophota bacterium]
MKAFNILILGAFACALSVWSEQSGAAETNQCPNFQEVYDTVRAHLVGADQANLNQAAVQGFLDQLKPEVSLVTPGTRTTPPEGPLLTKTRVFDSAYAYLRVNRVGTGLGDDITKVLRELKGTNNLNGLVIDLRFAGGQDYAAAAAAADPFVTKDQPLLTWGTTTARSSAKTNAVTLPVVVLMNHETTGAAEALAGILRETDVALLIGAPTAGQATAFQEFPLRDGQILRIATAAVKLGNGQPLSLQGLTPDIKVTVNAQDERAYFANPYMAIHKDLALLKEGDLLGDANTTNSPPRRRINEAELVRMQKEGLNPEEELAAPPPTSSETPKPTVQDPALARALDLLKGLAVVNRLRQP